MIALCFFLIIALILFLNSQNFFDAKNLLESATYITAVACIITFTLLFVGDLELVKSIYYLGFAVFFYAIIRYIKDKCKPNDLGVIANQQRYFNEVSAKDIYNFYATRKEIKSNRVEVRVNREDKKLMIQGVLTPSFFMDYFNMKLTHADNVEFIEQNKLYNVILIKIKDFSKQLELNINLEKKLQENGNYVEFFLLDLWEIVTPKFNISLANLEILAQSKIELELIYALDLLNLNSVKRKGAVLFFKFYKFKGRINEFLETEKDTE